MNSWEIVIIFVLGLCFGSFLSVLIWRLHTEEGGILFGRSHCPSCKKQLKVWNLIPVLSYVWQRGKCANCGKRIGVTYPLLEILTGGLWVMAAVWGGSLEGSLYYGLLFTLFAALAIYDLRWQELPDHFTFPAIFLAGSGAVWGWSGVSVEGALWGAAVFGIFFGVQLAAGRLFKKELVGSGDLVLGLALGLSLGLGRSWVALMLAYFAASMVSVLLMLTGKMRRNGRIALGPFLIVATIFTLFYGQEMIVWYWEKMGW